MARLSVELEQFFFEEERDPKVTLKDILELAGERTFGFLFVLLALPSALPVPAPGYAAPFGVVLFVIAVQLIMGRNRLWFPKFVERSAFDLKKIQGIVKAGIPWLRRIEALSRPRMSYLCTSLPGRVVIGIAIALMSISMMAIIPGTNTLPAMGIFITGFGLLDDDGLVSLAGLVVCAMGATLTTLIFLFGYEAVKAGIDLIRNTVF